MGCKFKSDSFYFAFQNMKIKLSHLAHVEKGSGGMVSMASGRLYSGESEKDRGSEEHAALRLTA